MLELSSEKLYVTSDTHIGHLWTARMRGLSTNVELHDRIIGDRIRAALPTKATLLLLGDISVNSRADTFAWFEKLGAERIILVPGNWDTEDLTGGPFEVTDEDTLRVDGEYVWKMSHYPYGNKLGLEDNGVQLLHGHTHKKSKFSLTAAGTPMVHVGWDAWHRPIPYSQITELLEGNA